jgi:hypothetical protein
MMRFVELRIRGLKEITDPCGQDSPPIMKYRRDLPIFCYTRNSKIDRSYTFIEPRWRA